MIVASIRWSQDIGWLLICQIGRLFNPLMEMLPLRRSYGKHKYLRRFIIFCGKLFREAYLRSNLKRRHVTTHNQCCRCCNSEETEKHTLFDCPYAQQIWRASGISNKVLTDMSATLEEKIGLHTEEQDRC